MKPLDFSKLAGTHDLRLSKWGRYYKDIRYTVFDPKENLILGFIGLGLVELDLDRAIDNLNAYVTEPGE